MADDAMPRPLADDELYLERVFAAPPQLVFDMWAKGEHMATWLGPAAARCAAADLDFRVGGQWSATVELETGTLLMAGRYLEIEPGRRIVKTFQWKSGEGDPETVITLGFYDLGDGRTRQTFHQTPFVNVARRDRHVQGWSACFAHEQSYLDTLTPQGVPS
jgi:uncharacterized protein YndB with AHSA1/START domain